MIYSLYSFNVKPETYFFCRIYLKMLLGHRSNDAVITICQNNAAKSIEITGLNKAGEELLGYRTSDLKGKPLFFILPPRIANMLKEYVEYESDANDVGQVLAKVQSFSTVSQDGRESGCGHAQGRGDEEGTLMFHGSEG